MIEAKAIWKQEQELELTIEENLNVTATIKASREEVANFVERLQDDVDAVIDCLRTELATNRLLVNFQDGLEVFFNLALCKQSLIEALLSLD